MNRNELKQRLVRAGWNLDDSFSGYLIIGYTNDLSVLAPEEAWDTEDPIFEIIEHERNATYWVNEVPTPQQAQELLQEHAEPPEKWEQYFSGTT